MSLFPSQSLVGILPIHHPKNSLGHTYKSLIFSQLYGRGTAFGTNPDISLCLFVSMSVSLYVNKSLLGLGFWLPLCNLVVVNLLRISFVFLRAQLDI